MLPLCLFSRRGEPSLDAERAGDVAFRRPTENGHVVPVPGQFPGERGRRSGLDKQEDVAPGAGDGDIEETALLSVRILFGRREHQVKQRIVFDLGRKAVLPGTQAEQDDVVGFESLGPMHRPVVEPQTGIALGQRGPVLRQRVPVSAQYQDA